MGEMQNIATRLGLVAVALNSSDREAARLIADIANELNAAPSPATPEAEPTPIEWQAIWDALAFTAQHAGLVSDAHNRVVDKVEAKLASPPAAASVTDDQVKVRPSHYRLTLKNVTMSVGNDSTYTGDVQVEAIDVIEALSEAARDFYVSTALLYLLRLGLKDKPRVEVKKAVWYLERWLKRNP